MLSIEQLTITAYLGDSEILCRDCGEKAGLPTSKALCAYDSSEMAGNEGLYCDDCGKEIEEPYEWTCPHCDTIYLGDEAADQESNYYRDSTAKCANEDCEGEEEESD
jgi:hypothetical protein